MHSRLVLLAAVSSLFAQEAAIRVDVQQVLVPVVVTDKKGHHVTGLHASDFRIFEDGVPQDIASFSTDASAAAADQGAQPARQSGPRRTFVICIDTLHASLANAARLGDALKNLFETQKSGDAQYVLIGIGRQLQVLQPATANPLAILVKIRSGAFQSAMGGLDASALAAQLQNIRGRMDEFCRQCACGTRSGARNCDSEIDTLKQGVDAEAERWIAPTAGLVEQFRSVVEELAKLPTGRTLILVSDGFNLNPKREFYALVSSYLPNQPQFKVGDSIAADPALRSALQTATDRNVTIDTIDSRGGATASLASTGAMDASSSGGAGSGYSMIGTNRPARSAGGIAPMESAPGQARSSAPDSASMEQLARSTGGVYFRNGDLLKQFRSALADGREYYLLAYVPKNSARDGKFRTITVETSDKKLTIRAKPGYWAQGAEAR